MAFLFYQSTPHTQARMFESTQYESLRTTSDMQWKAFTVAVTVMQRKIQDVPKLNFPTSFGNKYVLHVWICIISSVD